MAQQRRTGPLDRRLTLDQSFHATLDYLRITKNPNVRTLVGRAVRQVSCEQLPGPGDFEAEVMLLPHGVIRVWARRVASGLSLWLVYDFDAETVTALAVTDRRPIPIE